MKKIETIIYAMLEDDRLVVNTNTLEETVSFVRACKEILMKEDLIASDEDIYDDFSGAACFSIYGQDTCFVLEFGVLEHGSKEYFEEDFKDYNIVTLEELL